MPTSERIRDALALRRWLRRTHPPEVLWSPAAALRDVGFAPPGTYPRELPPDAYLADPPLPLP